MPGTYPDCSTCGHNASGVVAFQCTAFVPYPEGDRRGLAGYCECRCIDDPAVRAWFLEIHGPGALNSPFIQAGRTGSRPPKKGDPTP